MAFTYLGDLSVPLQYLRFRLDDKVEDFAYYQDEELQYFIDKIEEPITEIDLDKTALRLLKQQLSELLRMPTRERSGAFEVYRADAQSLQIAIDELEKDIKASRGLAQPSFGGVYKHDVISTRRDPSLVNKKFYEGRVYDPDATDRFDRYDDPLIR